MNDRRRGGIVALSTYVAVSCVIAITVNRQVPDPYLTRAKDEIFHVPQAQAYCSGQWTRWDPKLTTPPGLYLPVAAVAHLLRTPSLCTTDVLRGTNLVLSCLLPLQVHGLLRSLRGTEPDALEGLSISLFPLVYFFAFLYYTDVASLFAVLASLHAALERRPLLSAALGLLSLWFRQTNVLWVAYIAATAFSREVLSGTASGDPDLEEITWPSVASLPVSALSTAWKAPKTAIKVLAPYILVFAVFGVFLKWNGGVVLGDKDRHTAILHIPQVYYAIGSVAAFSWPVVLSPRLVRDVLRRQSTSPQRLVTLAILAAIMGWTVRRFTFQHPFLLADNRHYAFYVWRRVYRRHWIMPYALVPAYAVACLTLFRALQQARTMRSLPFLAYCVATVLSLVPSPLIEPRYFIVPSVVYRLHLRPSRRRVMVEMVYVVAINAATLWIFLRRPFRWPTEEGWQRFMW